MSDEIVPVIDLSEREIESALVDLFPIKILLKHGVIPISRRGSTVTIATADTGNIFAMDELKFITGYNIEQVQSNHEDIMRLLQFHQSVQNATSIVEKSEFDDDEPLLMDADNETVSGLDIEDFDSLISTVIDDVEVVETNDEDILNPNVEAPVIKLVNNILVKAIAEHVSDIHVEPFEKSVRIRYRQDGVLKKVMTLPAQIKNPVLSRLKIMARLDIAERRLPQDGRIKLKVGRNKEMDFRVSSLPTLYGEKIVLRLLDKSNLQLDLSNLGFDPRPRELFEKAIHEPWGMILVTGPTGSGKTTTLYSALAEVNKENANIMTAEDPIEYNLFGINQVQMNDQIGLNFAASLRSFLRQDPDIVMVGEIRDFETAEIAIKASLTGHLVLSTLHTNDAPSTINRLVNMGMEPFLVAGALNVIVAQRLARKICLNCKAVSEKPKKILMDNGLSIAEIEAMTLWQGNGCEKCSQSGYKGRVAFYEVLDIGSDIREMIILGSSVTELRDRAIENGMDTLRMAGLKKLQDGITTLDEVLRVTKVD